jgi:hypothetical protein
MGCAGAAPRRRRYNLSIAKLVGVIVGTSAATALTMGLWLLAVNGAFDSNPALVEDARSTSGSVDDVSTRFGIAVHRRFPIGSKESDLIQELIRERISARLGWSYSNVPGGGNSLCR